MYMPYPFPTLLPTTGLKSIPMMCWRFGVIFSGSCIIGIGVALLAAFLMKRFPMSGGRADGGGYAGDGNGVSNNGGVAQQDDGMYGKAAVSPHT